MKTTNKLFLTSIIAFTLLLSACKKSDKDQTDNTDNTTNSDRKVLVLNEGSFGNANAELSEINLSQNSVRNDIYFGKNNITLGDVLQDAAQYGDKILLSVNNSNKVEIVNLSDYSQFKSITGFSLPRYIQVVENKAYITEWIGFSGNGRVAVLDLTTFEISKTIAVGAQPENMLLDGNKLYVGNSGENTISIIDITTDAVTETITTNDGPNSIVKDIYGTIWVLCSGKTVYDNTPPDYIDEANSTAGSLIKLSGNTYQTIVSLNDVTGAPSKLALNGTGTALYYFYQNIVQAYDINLNTSLNPPLGTRTFYGLGIDPVNNNILVSTYGFSNSQKVLRYQRDGAVIDSFTVGIGPNGFLFIQ